MTQGSKAKSVADCPGCADSKADALVIATRRGRRLAVPEADRPPIYRRRVCKECGHRWTTWEMDEGEVLRLVRENESDAAGDAPRGDQPQQMEGHHAQ